MAVALRKKLLSNGKHSLYLDIYTEEGRKYEFLKLYLYKRPKDELEKQHNKETQKTAETIRAKRELAIGAAQNGEAPAYRSKVNFLNFFQQYIKSYTKKDVRMFEGALRYFTEFAGSRDIVTNGYVSLKSVTESLCFDFRSWLDDHENLSGETPYDYFARFKKVLKQAVRDKLIATNPAEEVTNKRADKTLQKDVLSVEEVQL
ncbi:hypothetical protein DYU11_04085 [Fibrisoma montanum]|uniref:Phage integrase SAM-like domain-containing protein n=1 Tax=Fibrisoma montanum TaxID=2305895 RepID=A0A418MJG9_9BACT|nr:phage integrase SAM-like domain and Arm DNA-binding domain-containing protein [Fibrisoma montanum]RIV27493.1 hypothetical protein DYU11_04085 [Fibrisoma montanum]